jgi:hypothetical protein
MVLTPEPFQGSFRARGRPRAFLCPSSIHFIITRFAAAKPRWKCWDLNCLWQFARIAERSTFVEVADCAAAALTASEKTTSQIARIGFIPPSSVTVPTRDMPFLRLRAGIVRTATHHPGCGDGQYQRKQRRQQVDGIVLPGTPYCAEHRVEPTTGR